MGLITGGSKLDDLAPVITILIGAKRLMNSPNGAQHGLASFDIPGMVAGNPCKNDLNDFSYSQVSE